MNILFFAAKDKTLNTLCEIIVKLSVFSNPFKLWQSRQSNHLQHQRNAMHTFELRCQWRLTYILIADNNY